MKKLLALALTLVLLLSIGAPALAFSAVLSPQNLTVDGKAVTCEKYNIDGSNYFKLRDLAQLLNHTASQFDVGWDAAKGIVFISTDHPYTSPNGTELVVGADQSATAQVSAQTIMVDGQVRTDLSVYNIGGSNFFKLRELGDALGFNVDYDAATNTAIVASGAATGKDNQYYDELRMYIGDKVSVIDPMDPMGGGTQLGIIDHMVYDTLVYYDISGGYAPCLATEWSANADATVWTFKLREGVKFHNGEPFTADDVVFTFEKAQGTSSTIEFQWNSVDHVEANGDYEVSFYLKSGNVDFIYSIASPTAVIVNREAYESGAEHAGWIGTGPFKVVDMVPNDSISYVANDDYWGEKPLSRKFTMRYIAEETSRYILLENDELDFANVSGQFIRQYSQDPRFVINSYVMNNSNFVAFNMRKAITGDKNFRLACAYAMDREEILDIALDGYGAIAETGVLWGYKTAYKNYSIPAWEQDLNKAKEYLAKSSYNGETLTIAAQSLPQTSKTAQTIQNELAAIGIKAEVTTCDSPAFFALTTWEDNDMDIIVASAAFGPLADSIRNMVTPYSGSNKACYENAEIVALLNQAAATPDSLERMELYYKIQEIMYEDLPYYPTFHMALYIAAQKGTGGAIFFPTSYHDYSMAYRLKNPR